ncbi:3-oxoacyl-(acyl-carrier-protein) synthase [Saccharopolyspora erythraea NRRL 2338]|uniref:3-oxoacyl-ACP synthase n=2 Tax=Saccharopolyspora erythraea TaxID=1836 RepID=A4FM54_SACEN|nr:beta-ketoacyl synthase N-terminal-like domain-containing protein [Saccharopolyspora erythraea]EQD84610.1 3-oxoacyl-ACP synthase [Saccharopolyspora erythraea D]PFG98767.1 3-oxoacyl-(acyl-carrier-protein) synthase [Saccharopolyspora erythraea NRRL 2338]QRK88771.1 3-oxoacyl-ACP synthase [Saccharopolyspora erythraea]CAM05129.1 putative 3-oxoacyl-ACP synthase [Saccharopolyspora erythraea NRRL 2338]
MSATAPGICGVGAVTGYGHGTRRLWEGLLSGKPAAALHHGFGHDGDQAAWVVRVPESPGPEAGSRFAAALHSAADEAVADARRRGWQPGPRVGVIHAAVLGEVDQREAFESRQRPWRKRDYLGLMPSTPVSNFIQRHGFHGPAMHVCAMCASGAAALLTARMWLEGGLADDVVVVAADVSATPSHVAHWNDIGAAVSDLEPLDACRPFQTGTRGFVMGEAAVGLVLSRTGTAYTRVLGGAMSQDAHHVISIDPGREQVMRCFRDALEDARVDPAEVGYLYAHGPGTPQCDDAEAAALEHFFPRGTGIYSTKQLTGHCQAASAALEVAIHALSAEHALIPAPAPVATSHPQLLTGHTAMQPGVTVKSALGMGGYNAVLALSAA